MAWDINLGNIEDLLLLNWTLQDKKLSLQIKYSQKTIKIFMHGDTGLYEVKC